MTSTVLRKLFVTLRPAHWCHLSWVQSRLPATEGDVELLLKQGGGREEHYTPSRPELPLGMEETNTPSLSLFYLLRHPFNWHFFPFPPPLHLMFSLLSCLSSLPFPFATSLPPLFLLSSSPGSQMNPLDGRGFSFAAPMLHVSIISNCFPKALKEACTLWWNNAADSSEVWWIIYVASSCTASHYNLKSSQPVWIQC